MVPASQIKFKNRTQLERAKNNSMAGLSDLEMHGVLDDEKNIYMMNPKRNSYMHGQSSIKTTTAYNYRKGKLSTRPTSSGLHLRNKNLNTSSSQGASASKVYKGRPLTA